MMRSLMLNKLRVITVVSKISYVIRVAMATSPDKVSSKEARVGKQGQ